MIKRRWLILAIFTFITICAWVAFEVLHARAQVEIDPKHKELMEPIDPEFNTKALDLVP